MGKEKKESDNSCRRCERCGSPNPIIWYAPHELWQKISGHPDDGGYLCVYCFDVLAREQDIYLRWTCENIATVAKAVYHYVRVDDEPIFAEYLAKMNKLGAEGYRVLQGANLGAAVIMEKATAVDVLARSLSRLAHSVYMLS